MGGLDAVYIPSTEPTLLEKAKTLVKLQFTWPQVAVLVVLLGAVILANVFAPGVVGAVISIVSTITGSLFVNLKEPPGPPDPPAFPVAPVLGRN